MTVESEVANLTSAVNLVTAAVNVAKSTLDDARRDAEAARDIAEGYKNSAAKYAVGTEPEGPGTKSALEWAGAAAISAGAALGSAETAEGWATNPNVITVAENIGVITDAAITTSPLSGFLGNLSAAIGQAYKETERLSGAQAGNDYSRGVLLELLSVVGQLADQINGGRASLGGGTLADPALRIGTAGVYSSAANTLSISISGAEVARFTASGLTVFGTVTTVP